MSHEPEVVERSAEMVLRGPVRLLWALLADSERVDRAIGALPSSYEVKEQSGDLGPLRMGNAATGLGPWTETGTWSEGRSFDGARNHLQGPIARIRYQLDLAGVDSGIRAGIRFSVTVRAPEARPMAEAMVERTMKRLAQFAQAAENLVAGVEDEPARAALRVVEPYLLRAPGSVLFRKPVPTNETALAAGIERLASASVDGTVREAIHHLLKEGPDEVLAEIRPRLIARTAGLGDRDVLHGFVEGVRAGLLNLEWRPLCAVCRGPTASRALLSALGAEAACLACAVSTPIDASRSLEAVFRVAPAVRDVMRLTHCASGLTFRPWVVAGAQAGPGESCDVELPGGGTGLEIAIRGRYAPVGVLPPNPPQRMEVVFDASGNCSVTFSSSDRPVLRVINHSSGFAEVEVRRTQDDPERTLAIDLFNLPAFRDVFAGDRPDAGTSLTVGRVALLFADVCGSSAVYNKIGDGPAYALVEQSFSWMRAVVEESGGVVVKTMGDAVLASFAEAGRAIEASFALHRASRELLHNHGLELRIGLNEGPCLAVDANGRLDYFGTEVNLAARLQGSAGPGQTAIRARIGDLHKDRLSDGQIVRESVRLKGFAEPIECIRIHHGS